MRNLLKTSSRRSFEVSLPQRVKIENSYFVEIYKKSHKSFSLPWAAFSSSSFPRRCWAFPIPGKSLIIEQPIFFNWIFPSFLIRVGAFSLILSKFRRFSGVCLFVRKNRKSRKKVGKGVKFGLLARLVLCVWGAFFLSAWLSLGRPGACRVAQVFRSSLPRLPRH